MSVVADVSNLRDHVVRLARDQRGPLNGKFVINDVYKRVTEFYRGSPPVARGTFYAWFRTDDTSDETPKQALVECIPAFAHILGVPEHELWQAAGVLPERYEVGLSLAQSANAVRNAYRGLQKTLSDSGLSTAGEALVVDRILHAKLDLDMAVWPIVRGYRSPLHLHSWIALTLSSPDRGRIRDATARMDQLRMDQQRAYLRETVITESLWRGLGLQWRTRVAPEFAYVGTDPLLIEVPVEERNRVPSARPVHDDFEVERILVLGPPWAHAELMAALLAEALHFGSWDLRYVGLSTREDIVQFSRSRLAERRSRYVWALAQRVDSMRELRPDVIAAGPGTLVIVVTYGQRMAEYAGDALGATHGTPADAQRVVMLLADQLEEDADVIRVHLADSDVLSKADRIDKHLVGDTIVELTAEVLNQLHLLYGGPPLPQWGDRFKHFRLGDEAVALDLLRGRTSTVQRRPKLP